MLLLLLILCLLNQVRETVSSPTHAPTAMPTKVQTVNATIRNGYLTIGNSFPVYVGVTSRRIQYVVDTYFPKPVFKSVEADTASNVWLNSTTNTFSYLTLVGKYVADNPLVLPSQFMLVMQNASLTALWNFTAVADSSDLVNPQKGNALVIFNNVQLSGVISPRGPAGGIFDCSAIPSWYYSAGGGTYNGVHYAQNTVRGMAPTGSVNTMGPDGIVSVSSSGMYFDGFKVLNCGLTSANLALFKTNVVEVQRTSLGYGGVRGIWVIITTRASIHNNEIYGSVKFAIDLDANSGPFTLISNNHIYNNSYQAVFIEQGSQYSVVSGNDLGPGNQNSVSFFNNLFVPTAAGHVIHDNKMYESTGAGLNIGSISCAIGTVIIKQLLNTLKIES